MSAPPTEEQLSMVLRVVNCKPEGKGVSMIHEHFVGFLVVEDDTTGRERPVRACSWDTYRHCI